MIIHVYYCATFTCILSCYMTFIKANIKLVCLVYFVQESVCRIERWVFLVAADPIHTSPRGDPTSKHRAAPFGRRQFRALCVHARWHGTTGWWQKWIGTPTRRSGPGKQIKTERTGTEEAPSSPCSETYPCSPHSSPVRCRKDLWGQWGGGSTSTAATTGKPHIFSSTGSQSKMNLRDNCYITLLCTF